LGEDVPITAMTNENLFLIHSVMMGVYLTFVYDNVRIFRRIVPHNTLFISLEDVAYWIYLAVEVFLLMYHESNGLLRWFAVAGALAGIWVYKKLFGRFYVHYVSLLLKKIIQRIRRIFKIRLKSERKLLKIRLCKR